jgi:death-on-curing protein
VSRPQVGYYTEIIEEAAALWESLGQNHPFIDGNKRTAFAATYTFLIINDLEIKASADETYRLIANLYEANAFRFEALVRWLRANT